ncbi:multi-sensor hybrid histidine kinase [Methylobacterium sp. 4-46]|uniref:MHYT domain-containing protein n=1 Tax=unclassified Methylobacterium TaxID=2615210 RepID=UPI000152D4D4|nr:MULTISPECIES: MHYT domain-containing protein [Methylobacterium]ACA16520.1 multi-sensor hybrid histidine kinase [Methylobacterium sp. 4-46]WFT82229.1 MHYT domain-containing protein [Methylobacterium nodulans]
MPHPGTHDTTLVALSVVIAMIASYTALDLAARMRAASGWAALAWLATAALAMGGGVWSMHFVGMLAFTLPGLEVSYDLTLTLISLALPIGVTALGFLVAHRWPRSLPALAASGLVMGLGVAAMHYTGMRAMRMRADLQHAPAWVAVSLLIAVGAATAALRLSARTVGFAERIAAATLMGLAVAGMHYAAMQGAEFSASAPIDPGHGAASLRQTHLALWVTGTTFLILMLALIAATFDRHLADRASREAIALRESEERFRLLLRSVTDYAIFMLDGEGRVANWNAGAERIMGYRDHEVIGTHVSRFSTQEDRARDLPGQALRIAAGAGKFETEGWRLRKDGSRFFASVVIDPVRDPEGRLIGYAKVTRDITERRQALEALEQARVALFQAQKMEALGQLTGGVAHDFNNLLMAVLGSLELLRKRLPDDPKLTRLLDNAVQGAQRGAALTQRMLAFARRQDLRPETVILPDLVQGMSDLLERSLGPAVRIETRFPPDLSAATADAHQLELALLNLAVNARDAMPEGGQLTIAARERAADEAPGGEAAPEGLPPGRYVCLSVRDTGQGMDEATLARAREPFFTTKGVGKGTGLGLSMVHGLAEQSGGRLVLRSRPGEGTLAEIWLPAAPRPQRSERPAPARSLPRAAERALTVLVVDDDLLVLENTAAMLEDLGHRVIEARSGAEALGLLASAMPLDLVLTDQIMPAMTGLQLLEQVRAARPEIGAILASGFAEIPSGAAPAVTRLAKPFDQATLARTIEAALAASRDERISALRAG